MPVPPPAIHRFYQTSADKRFLLMSGPPPTFVAGGPVSSAARSTTLDSIPDSIEAQGTSAALDEAACPLAPVATVATVATVEAEYRVYFNLERGAPSRTALGAVVLDVGPLDPPCASAESPADGAVESPAYYRTLAFHAPALEHTVYYVCIRAVNPLTGEESQNVEQRIVPICELLRAPITVVAYGPGGAIYTRDPDTCNNHGQPARLLRSLDQGDSWEVLCPMPGDSGDVPGFAVDSRGYLYCASSPTPCISRDDGQTFEPMRGPAGEAVNLAHATEFWYPAWNVTELLPGAHPRFPHGGIFLSTYANPSGRGPSDPGWMQPDASHVWYDGNGNLESDHLGRGYRIFYALDAERRVWDYLDVSDYDHPNDPGPSGAIPLADRHIHGFKINPYAPGDWYLSAGDGLWVAQTEANFAEYGRDWAPYNWVWEGNFSKRRGLYRFDAGFQDVVELPRPCELNGPTGLAFFPDGSLLVSDDNGKWGATASVDVGVRRYNRDGGQIEYFNPSALDGRLTGVMYDAITLEGTNIAFVTIDDDSRLGRSDTAILTNLNGVWETLIQLPGTMNIEMLSADSRKLIPRDAQYLFANVLGLGGIRIPLGRLAHG